MVKLKVAVIFGGKSSEHDISRASARNIIDNLDKERYEVLPLGITKEGAWLLCSGNPDTLCGEGWEKGSVHKAIISPDAQDKCILILKSGGTERISIDAAFIALHGKNGEDGTIQGLLTLAGIPYCGSGVLSSALCMDKAMAKHIFEQKGIPQARWLVFRRHDLNSPSDVLKRVADKFSYPVFVKPSSAGSSIGAQKVASAAHLISAIKEGFLHDEKVLVEENINAREVECGIIGNESPCAAPLGEVVTEKEFFDFEAKYTVGLSYNLIPADIPEDTAEELKSLAARAYKAADCRGFARVDFFIEKQTGRILLNEINTIPGFTNVSAFPMMWQKQGLTFPHLLDKIIEYAMEK